jgi:phosphomannomutase
MAKKYPIPEDHPMNKSVGIFKKIIHSLGLQELVYSNNNNELRFSSASHPYDNQEEAHRLKKELEEANEDMRIALESLGGKADRVIAAADRLLNNKNNNNNHH